MSEYSCSQEHKAGATEAGETLIFVFTRGNIIGNRHHKSQSYETHTQTHTIHSHTLKTATRASGGAPVAQTGTHTHTHTHTQSSAPPQQCRRLTNVIKRKQRKSTISMKGAGMVMRQPKRGREKCFKVDRQGQPSILADLQKADLVHHWKFSDEDDSRGSNVDKE